MLRMTTINRRDLCVALSAFAALAGPALAAPPGEGPPKVQTAPKKGMFRLTPASAVAETVWKAYGSDRLHWYVPEGIAWIDRIKGFAPSFMRRQIGKNIAGLFGDKSLQSPK